MPIEAKSNIRVIDVLCDQMVKILMKNIKDTLSYVGLECVKKIRDRSAEDSWKDQTGNLRSSIGFAILDYGRKVIESAFEIVKNGSEGPQESRKYINELAALYASTYALVVVAGMSYADYVEAIDGKDVLASTELWAKANVDGYVRRAVDKSINEINKLIAA